MSSKERVMFSASRSLTLLLLLSISAGCSTQAYHPSKTPAQMRADIQQCKKEARRKFWSESMSAAGYAYECLEQNGYVVEDARWKWDSNTASQPETPPAPAKPCRVPCRLPNSE
jgi:hypothetical protein